MFTLHNKVAKFVTSNIDIESVALRNVPGQIIFYDTLQIGYELGRH